MEELRELMKRGRPNPVIEKALVHMEEASGAELSQLCAICAGAFFQKVQYNDAAVMGEKAVQADPENGEAWSTLGWAEYWLGITGKALDHIQKACELMPNSATVHYRLGSILSNAFGKLDEAETAFSRAVELDPTMALAWQQRGICRWNRNNRQGAEEDYRRGAEAGDAWCGYILEYNGFPLNSSLEKVALARDCWGQNQSQRAIDLLQEALEQGFDSDQLNLDIRLELADKLSAMKLGEAATANYDRAIEEFPESADAYGRRGWHYYCNSMDDQAEQDLRKAMELDPDNSLYPAWLGNLYAVSERPDLGIRVLDPAIEKDPFTPELYYSRALCRMKKCLDQEARKDFHAADFLGHRNALADCRQAYGDNNAMDFFSSGLDAGGQNDFKLAVEKFHKAHEMFDAEKQLSGDRAWRYASKSLHNQGYYQHMAGVTDEAESNLKKALDLVPHYKDAWITLGNLYNSTNRQEKALECYNRAVELQPNDGRGYYSRGRVNMARGDYDAGADDFSMAITFYQRRDWKGDAYYNRGTCHEKAGRVTEAIADYEEAFNHGIQQGIQEAIRLKDTHGLD